MATHASALKRHRQSLKRRDRNRNAKSTIRTTIKKCLQLLEKGDVTAASTQARLANKLLDKAAIHGVLHKKTASRTVSRLFSKISTKEAPKAAV